MTGFKTLNPGVNELIHRELQKTIRDLEHAEICIKSTEEELNLNKKMAHDLSVKKEELEEILRTHDATYTNPKRFTYPTEFKVRE